MKLAKVLGLVLLLTVVGASLTFSNGQKITFYSTQMRPIEEAQWARTTLLPPFTSETGIGVDFIADEYSPWAARLIGEHAVGKGTIDLVGGLHGDFLGVPGTMADISGTLWYLQGKGDRTFIESFVKMGQMGGIQAYIPWMQATYLMVINKKALQYLPAGVDYNALTYDQLLAWAKNIYEATGEKKLGIPAGPKSLLHRFVHGYLYPSFTGSMVKEFNSPEAVTMWKYAQDLWQYVNPSATSWDAMAEPLLDGSVWIAWDHTARVKDAIKAQPNNFIAIPSPAGLKGRGAIAVLAGLGIPKNAPDPVAAVKLIEYLTRPSTQVEILNGIGFFPIVKEAASAVPTGAMQILAQGVTAQAGAPDAIVAMIPGGLGARAGEFSKIYRDTFTEIVIKGKDINATLTAQGKLLKELFADTGAACPPPDPTSEAPCVPENIP